MHCVSFLLLSREAALNLYDLRRRSRFPAASASGREGCAGER